MNDDAQRVSLANLAGGAVVERFDDELQRVLENILDPNTTLAKREVTLKVTIEPDKNRNVGAIAAVCTSKVAPASTVEATVFIGRTRDGVIATEHTPQMAFPEMGIRGVIPLNQTG